MVIDMRKKLFEYKINMEEANLLERLKLMLSSRNLHSFDELESHLQILEDYYLERDGRPID
jgi:hypothetical protein